MIATDQRLAAAAADAADARRGCTVVRVHVSGTDAGPLGAVLAAGLIVAGAHASPRCQMPCGGEAGHVGADLNQDHLRGPGMAPWDSDQYLHRHLLRVQ